MLARNSVTLCMRTRNYIPSVRLPDMTPIKIITIFFPSVPIPSVSANIHHNFELRTSMGAQSNHSQCHAGVDSSQLCMIEYCCRINNYYQYVHKSVQVKEVLRESGHEDVGTHIVLACYLI